MERPDDESSNSLDGEGPDSAMRREMLARRPSYRKILNDLSAGADRSNEDDEDTEGSIQMTEGRSIQTVTMSSSDPNVSMAGATIVQYAQAADGQLLIPAANAYQLSTITGQGVMMSHLGGTEEASRKRELRLLKNREAAKECRRKKKEYVKCLENRVAVLENQNKTLVEELKSLKELYCQKDTVGSILP